MPAIPLSNYLILSTLLFAIGAFGVLARRNAVGMLMSIELMLNAANINFIAFWRYSGSDSPQGILFAIIAITVAAAAAAVGLALVLLIARRYQIVDVDRVNLMKG